MRFAVLTLALLAAGHALRLVDVPVPREGQWEKTSDEEGGVMHTYRLCEDGKRVAALHLGMECAGPTISHPVSADNTLPMPSPVLFSVLSPSNKDGLRMLIL